MLRKDNCEVIFLGDLNYRIEISKQEYMQLHANIVNTEASLNYSSLLDRDQLYLQKELRKGFLERFEEGAIRFPPTYKIGNFVLSQVWRTLYTTTLEFQDGPIASSTDWEESLRENHITAGTISSEATIGQFTPTTQ